MSKFLSISNSRRQSEGLVIFPWACFYLVLVLIPVVQLPNNHPSLSQDTNRSILLNSSLIAQIHAQLSVSPFGRLLCLGYSWFADQRLISPNSSKSLISGKLNHSSCPLCFASLDPAIMMNMGSSSMGMAIVFTNSHTTPLYSTSWTPNSAGSYAGTCIFLIILASILRCLLAFRSFVEHRWLAQARNRRYVAVKGKTTEAGKFDSDPNAKEASLITAQGVEEPVKVVRAYPRGVIPFRLSVDVPRAAIVFVIAGVYYLL
jgi:hypothetical protein